MIARLCILLVLCTLGACSNEKPSKKIETKINVTDLNDVDPRAIVVAFDEETVRARGFSNAVPSGATVMLQLPGHPSNQTIASESGRFDLILPVARYEKAGLEKAKLVVISKLKSTTLNFQIRNVKESLAKIPGKPIVTGAMPNDLLLATLQNRLMALIPTSQSAELQMLALDDAGDELKSSNKVARFLPDTQNRLAAPWSLSLSDDQRYLAVSLQGQHKVALLDASNAKLLDAKRVENSKGELLLIDVDPIITLRTNLDVLLNGTTTPSVSKMAARHPQGVLIVKDQVLVTFTNLLEFAEGPTKPSSFGPGLLATFEITNGKLDLVDTYILPCKNPGGITQDQLRQVWVICNGALHIDEAGGFSLKEPAALLKLKEVTIGDATRFKVDRAIDFGARFLPGQPAFVDRHLVVGNSIGSDIVILPKDAQSINEAQSFSLSQTPKESNYLPCATLIFGGLVLVADAQKDRLIVVDVEMQEINPWPFDEGILLNREGAPKIPKGPSAIAMRPGRAGVDFEGPDVFVVLGYSSQLMPLTTSWMMGP